MGHRITGDRTRNCGIGWNRGASGHQRPLARLVCPDQDGRAGENCAPFLRMAEAYCASLSVCIDRLVTEQRHGLLRPGLPQAGHPACANAPVHAQDQRPGRALRAATCASGSTPSPTSAQREAARQPFLHRYNGHRSHCALNRQPPMRRIPAMNNLRVLREVAIRVDLLWRQLG